MSTALIHNMRINPPREIDFTKEEFNKLSYYGLSNFLMDFPASFMENKDSLRLYMTSNVAWVIMKNHRFVDIDFYENSSTEMIHCDIPNDHPLNTTIRTKFGHLILK